MIYSYNKNQQDAPFLIFILVKNSKCFGQIYCPSLGVLIMCSQQLVFVMLVMLTVYKRGWDGTQCQNMSSTTCCEYSIKTADDGQ